MCVEFVRFLECFRPYLYERSFSFCASCRFFSSCSGSDLVDFRSVGEEGGWGLPGVEGAEECPAKDPGVVNPEWGMNPSKIEKENTDWQGMVFNEFFYKNAGPDWMGAQNDASGYSRDENEEGLLDDVHHFRSISRTCSIDSNWSSYSRTASLTDSQESAFWNDAEAENEVVLRVPMCCGSCENKVKTLTQMEGVTSVTCERRTEKVTVIGTARPALILEACKKLFEQAKPWKPEDEELLNFAVGNAGKGFYHVSF